jgi:hypothetical protein
VAVCEAIPTPCGKPAGSARIRNFSPREVMVVSSSGLPTPTGWPTPLAPAGSDYLAARQIARSALVVVPRAWLQIVATGVTGVTVGPVDRYAIREPHEGPETGRSARWSGSRRDSPAWGSTAGERVRHCRSGFLHHRETVEGDQAARDRFEGRIVEPKEEVLGLQERNATGLRMCPLDRSKLLQPSRTLDYVDA